MRISIYTTSTGECRISEPSTVSTLSKPTFVALASPSRAASSKARKHQASWQFLKTAQEMRETPFFFSGGPPKKRCDGLLPKKKNHIIVFGVRLLNQMLVGDIGWVRSILGNLPSGVV